MDDCCGSPFPPNTSVSISPSQLIQQTRCGQNFSTDGLSFIFLEVKSMILETGVQTILVINCEIIFVLVQKTERFRYYRPQEGRDQSLNQS